MVKFGVVDATYPSYQEFSNAFDEVGAKKKKFSDVMDQADTANMLFWMNANKDDFYKKIESMLKASGSDKDAVAALDDFFAKTLLHEREEYRQQSFDFVRTLFKNNMQLAADYTLYIFDEEVGNEQARENFYKAFVKEAPGFLFQEIKVEGLPINIMEMFLISFARGYLSDDAARTFINYWQQGTPQQRVHKGQIGKEQQEKLGLKDSTISVDILMSLDAIQSLYAVDRFAAALASIR